MLRIVDLTDEALSLTALFVYSIYIYKVSMCIAISKLKSNTAYPLERIERCAFKDFNHTKLFPKQMRLKDTNIRVEAKKMFNFQLSTRSTL
jgi:hypothetical protein